MHINRYIKQERVALRDVEQIGRYRDVLQLQVVKETISIKYSDILIDILHISFSNIIIKFIKVTFWSFHFTPFWFVWEFSYQIY